MKQAILLIGNIGSGKSTLARKYAEKGFFVIDQDSIREMIGAGRYIFTALTEPIIKDMSSFLIERFCQEGISFVVDGALVNDKVRAGIISIIKKYPSYEIIAHILKKIDKKEAVDRRMNGNSRGYPRELWEEVYDKFETKTISPRIEEGIDLILNDDIFDEVKRIQS